MELAITYAPQNTYCFSIDQKASQTFHIRVKKLAECFSKNVFVANYEYRMDSAGHNQTRAQLQCFKQLLERKWEYVFILQVNFHKC